MDNGVRPDDRRHRPGRPDRLPRPDQGPGAHQRQQDPGRDCGRTGHQPEIAGE